MSKLTDNFDSKELACPCCNNCVMDKEFMNNLQDIREECGFGFRINSGYRCKEHNSKVSKNSMGDHARGYAVDIACNNRYKRSLIVTCALLTNYFKDIAIDKKFIHLGKGKTKQGIGVY